MKTHRISLTDGELAVIYITMVEYWPSVHPEHRAVYERLLRRLEAGGVGNPNWRFRSVLGEQPPSV